MFCLKPPPLVKKLFYGDVTRVVFRTRTIGTQTHANENEFEFEFEKDMEITEDEVLPLCETCGKGMDVYGPLGLKRSQHFGKYFIMCKICQKRADSKIAVTLFSEVVLYKKD